MRFIFGVLIGYSMRGKDRSLIIVLATMAFIVYIVVPTVVFSVALLALSLDVHHERRSRPALTKVPAIKGLSYEDAEIQLHASNLNIRVLATRYDLPLQPAMIIDQSPQPGEEVVYGYPVGVTLTRANSPMVMVRNGQDLLTQPSTVSKRARKPTKQGIERQETVIKTVFHSLSGSMHSCPFSTLSF